VLGVFDNVTEALTRQSRDSECNTCTKYIGSMLLYTIKYIIYSNT